MTDEQAVAEGYIACARCRMIKACVCGKTFHERHQLDGLPWKRDCDECSTS